MSVNGEIVWQDLTVPDAAGLKDFYASVVGWRPQSEDMGGYEDYHMLLPKTGAMVAGICHARGDNGSLPAQWLMYVRVGDVHKACAAAQAAGGEVLDGPRAMGQGWFACLRDPAGAVFAVFQTAVE